MTVRCAFVAAVILTGAAAAGAQSFKYTPLRLLSGGVSALPAVTIAGGGEVLIEAIVDRAGIPTRPSVLKGTPPYTQFVLEALATWRFEPARAVGPDGREAPVEMPVTIGALYRPPVLMNSPTIGEPTKDFSKPSMDVAYPVITEMPNYPSIAREGGVVLFEVALNEAGGIIDARVVSGVEGFDGASREALARWRFRGAAYRARPVPSKAYVLFGFRPPIVSPPSSPTR